MELDRPAASDVAARGDMGMGRRGDARTAGHDRRLDQGGRAPATLIQPSHSEETTRQGPPAEPVPFSHDGACPDRLLTTNH